MKNNILIIISFLFVFSSCKKFLEEIPQDQVTNANFYQTDNDAIAAINGVYQAMRFEVGNGIPTTFMLEQISDDGCNSPLSSNVQERIDLDIMNYNSYHTTVATVWNNSYTVINRANNVIKFVTDTTKIKDSIVRRVQAQARFLRAFYHFRLVQMFGDIPLMLEPADVQAGNLFPRRTPTKVVYDTIISDLKFAERNLDSFYAYSSANGGRVTMAAAKVLLGKVYLTMAGYPLNLTANYSLAADKLNEVIQNKIGFNTDLNTSYANIFTTNVATKQADKERIFFTRGTSGLAATFGAFTRMGWSFRDFRFTTPTKDFATNAIASRRVYETGDLRRNVVANSFDTAGARNSLVVKYAAGTDAGDDFIWLRYSDVLMMYAEALLEIGGTANLDAALSLINSVRRAHGGTTIPLLTYTDQADLRTKLQQERRREFAFECQRWFDLKRWDILIPSIKSSLVFHNNTNIAIYDFIDKIDPNRYKVLPIPFQETVNNPNITQNPGF